MLLTRINLMKRQIQFLNDIIQEFNQGIPFYKDMNKQLIARIEEDMEKLEQIKFGYDKEVFSQQYVNLGELVTMTYKGILSNQVEAKSENYISNFTKLTGQYFRKIKDKSPTESLSELSSFSQDLDELKDRIVLDAVTKAKSIRSYVLIQEEPINVSGNAMSFPPEIYLSVSLLFGKATRFYDDVLDKLPNSILWIENAHYYTFNISADSAKGLISNDGGVNELLTNYLVGYMDPFSKQERPIKNISIDLFNLYLKKVGYFTKNKLRDEKSQSLPSLPLDIIKIIFDHIKPTEDAKNILITNKGAISFFNSKPALSSKTKDNDKKCSIS